MEISVIVLTYNQEKTIGRTLDSILNQKTDFDFEIIIGDDCSKDSTEKVCREYLSKYPDKIRYLRREKNLGLLKNYYDCFSKAKGKYIADCSGDDYWTDPNKVQNQVAYLEANPDVNLVSGEWVCENSFTKEISRPHNEAHIGCFDKKDLVKLFINESVFNISASLYRKGVITEMMDRNPDIFLGQNCKFEDLQIIMSCADKGKIVMLPGVVMHYCIGHDSVSHKIDFFKQFTYSFSTILQLKELQHIFLQNTTPEEKRLIKEYYSKKGDYLSVLAFKSGPENFKTNPVKEIGIIPKGPKGVFYCALMKNRMSWKWSLKIWKFVFPGKFN